MLITSTDQNGIGLKISRRNYPKLLNVMNLGKANYYLGLNKSKIRKYYIISKRIYFKIAKTVWYGKL